MSPSHPGKAADHPLPSATRWRKAASRPRKATKLPGTSPTHTRKPPIAAVAALAKAIELDPRYRAWAKTDADYDPIRDDPAFRKLACGE